MPTASLPWTEQTIHFLDFEGSRTSGVLEYGVVTILGGSVRGAEGRLCGATGRVRSADTVVHGLDRGSVAGLAPFSDDWERFARLREDGPLAAHYAGVENGLLKSVWPYPRPSPDFARPGRSVVDWGPWLDSARLHAQFRPGAASTGLEALIASLGLQGELSELAGRYCDPARRRYHAALYDALAGALLLIVLARDPAWARLTTMQMLSLSTLDPRKRGSLGQDSLW
jgi:DNA polymerase III epsilon subunit-like protein